MKSKLLKIGIIGNLGACIFNVGIAFVEKFIFNNFETSTTNLMLAIVSILFATFLAIYDSK